MGRQRNPDLIVRWPSHLSTEGCQGCGASFEAFRLKGLPLDPGARLGWVKRQLTGFDRDQEWWWCLRTMLWGLHYLKAQEFIAVHSYCEELLR